MIVHLKDLLIVCIVLQLHPLVPLFAACLNALQDTGVDDDFPFAFDTGLARVSCASDLDCFANLGLGCKCLCKVF